MADGRCRIEPGLGCRPSLEAQGRSFDLLLGRRTYDIWAGYWPKAENSPIADGLNAATKYVATHRPDSLGWGPVEDLGADIMEGVRGVKSKDGPDLIVWGSSTLTSVLLEQGLVDEVVLIVYPVLLGRGKRFFSDSADPRELALVSTKATSSGVLMNTYRHVGSLRTDLSPTRAAQSPWCATIGFSFPVRHGSEGHQCSWGLSAVGSTLCPGRGVMTTAPVSRAAASVRSTGSVQPCDARVVKTELVSIRS